MKKIVIAGGTGFVGSFLRKKFMESGVEVLIVSRKDGDIHWNNTSALINAIDDSDVVINLAGKSVDCRYNEVNKREILESRIETTRQIGNAIPQCSRPPKIWINASTATIYRHAEDRPMTEQHGEIGSGFSVDVALQWEKTFFETQLPRTRQVALRMAIVLGNGGVMQPLKRLTQFGLGGKQGSGTQMFSWIHIDDLYRIILFVIREENLEAVVNCASPYPVTNEVLMKSVRKAMGIKIGLPAPRWLLEAGAVLIRTETELVLKSRWVVPARLLDRGFEFKYPKIELALKQILG